MPSAIAPIARAGRFRGRRQGQGPRNRRDRIEHAQVVAPMDFARFAELHVIASMQPSHQTRTCAGPRTASGASGIMGAYALGHMLKKQSAAGVWPLTIRRAHQPVSRLYACVTRERPMAARKTGGSRKKKSRSKIASAPTPQDPLRAVRGREEGELSPANTPIHHSFEDLTKGSPRPVHQDARPPHRRCGRTVYESR